MVLHEETLSSVHCCIPSIWIRAGHTVATQNLLKKEFMFAYIGILGSGLVTMLHEQTQDILTFPKCFCKSFIVAHSNPLNYSTGRGRVVASLTGCFPG
jgi:hypothetical protein